MKRILAALAAITLAGPVFADPPARILKSCEVTCGTSATLIACTSPGFTVIERTILNNSGSTVRVGGSGVTTSAGGELPNGSALVDNVRAGTAPAPVYCAVSGGGKAVTVYEGG